MNKQIKCPENEIYYTWISEHTQNYPKLLRCHTYEDAVSAAEFDQPAYRPYYIVKITESFEIVGKPIE